MCQNCSQRKRRRFQKRRSQRDQNNQAEIQHGVSQRQSEARQVAAFFESESHSLLIRLIDLVEHSSVGKMCFLRLLPASENFINRDQL